MGFDILSKPVTNPLMGSIKRISPQYIGPVGFVEPNQRSKRLSSRHNRSGGAECSDEADNLAELQVHSVSWLCASEGELVPKHPGHVNLRSYYM